MCGAIEGSASAISEWGRGLDARAKKLEAVLGSESYVRLSWLMKSLQRAQGVARIWRGARAVGTGFLLPGGNLSSKWKSHQVLVTNNHVISKNPVDPRTIYPEEATLTFDALSGTGPNQPGYEVKEVLLESPIEELDFTFLRLDKEVERIEDFAFAKTMPRKTYGDRVYVIGHPRGEELSFSIHDNVLLDINERRVHYRSPTEPGSSGSPLFNDDWSLIGIHHAGGKEMKKLDDPRKFYEANEGIPLPIIRAEIADRVGA